MIAANSSAIAIFATRYAAGAIVGENLAKRFGWKVGDTIPLQATIFPQKDGSNAWPLTLRGTFKLADSKRKGEENQLIFHWKYFDEANQYVNGQVGWYIVKLDNVNHATRVAKAVDVISENSAHETKTQTEQAFNQSFAKQFADIGLIVTAIMAASSAPPRAVISRPSSWPASRRWLPRSPR